MIINFFPNVIGSFHEVTLIQAIPGNDQNASPTNQKTARSKLERTSYLMFYGSWRHLESFSGNFLV